MKILDQERNENFSICNGKMVFQKQKPLVNVEKPDFTCWIGDEIKTYKSGALYTKYYGYERVSNMIFFDNNGQQLFAIDTQKTPQDPKLNKSRADKLSTLVFDNGVLVSTRNIENQCRYDFYFYDKKHVFGYDFDEVINKVKDLSTSRQYTNLILKYLQQDEDDLEQE